MTKAGHLAQWPQAMARDEFDFKDRTLKDISGGK